MSTTPPRRPTRSRQFEVASTASVLDELLGGPAPEDIAAIDTPTADTAPGADQQQADMTPTTDTHESAPSRTRVQHTRDTAGTARPAKTPSDTQTRATPPGKKRQTFYVSDDVVAALNAAAEQLSTQLGGLVPKHRILGALITAGIGQSRTVAATLRAELMDSLQQD